MGGIAGDSSSARNAVFLCASFSAATLGGLAYSFPIFILDFKHVLALTETTTNVLGIMVYATVSLIGMPLAPPLIARHLGLLKVLAVVLAPGGYFMLYSLSIGWIVPGRAAIAMACLGIVALMTSLGLLFPYCMGRCMEKYGPTSATWVNALLNFGFASGGLIGSLVYYYLQPLLSHFLLAVTLTHAVGTTLCVAALHVTHGPAPADTASASPASRAMQTESEESDPLLEGRRDTNSPEQIGFVASLPVPYSTVLWRMLRSVDYVLVCLIMFLKVGIGGSFSTNIGAILESKGATDRMVALAVVNLVSNAAIIVRQHRSVS